MMGGMISMHPKTAGLSKSLLILLRSRASPLLRSNAHLLPHLDLCSVNPNVPPNPRPPRH